MKPVSMNSPKMQLALDIADRVTALVNSKPTSPSRHDLYVEILGQLDCGPFQVGVTERPAEDVTVVLNMMVSRWDGLAPSGYLTDDDAYNPFGATIGPHLR